MSNYRVPLYYELFYGLSENDKIEQGLQIVASTESQCGPVIREMAQAVLEEIAFFRKFKKSRFKLKPWIPPKVELNLQQAIEMERCTSYPTDPLLLQLAIAVCEEVESNRSYRKLSHWVLYVGLFVCLIGFVTVNGVAIWALT